MASSSVWSARITMSKFAPNPNVLPGGGWQFKQSTPNTPGTNFGDPPPPRMWVDGVMSGVRSVIGTDVVTLAGRAGPLAVNVAQGLTVAEAVGAAVGCLSNPLCFAATAAGAVAITSLFKDYRIIRGDDGSLSIDPGQPEEEKEGFECTTGSTPPHRGTGRSPDAACGEAAAKWAAAASYTSAPDRYGCTITVVISVGSVSGGVAKLNNTTTFNGRPDLCGTGTQTSPWAQVGGAIGTKVKDCPYVIDALNPAFSGPGKLGRDGKCNSGRYNPITPDHARDKVVADPPTPQSKMLEEAVKVAIDSGGQESPAAIETSGPASQTGTPATSTTTGPSGTSSTTTTPTYSYTYAGDTVKYETNIKTETCVGANSCSTTTETPAPVTPLDPKDPCTQNPDRAGCAKLGTPPDPEEIKKKDIPITVNPDGGFGADNGSCPGPITLSNGTRVDPYKLFCTYMGGIRFAVIGIAWLIAALIFIGRIE